MRGSKPAPAPGSVIELSSDDLVDVDGNRASIIAAAASAQNIAMLTGTHGVVSPPLLAPRARLPRAEDVHPGARASEDDDEELARLRAFVQARAGAADTVGELRARLELARAELRRGRVDAARTEARAASRTCEHAPAAHAMLRGLHLGRAELDEQLAAVTELAAHSTSDRTRADWLAERARLMEAREGATDASVVVWREALALVPSHAGALYGLEAALDRLGRHAELADLLGRVAELVGDDEAAAWLHVERAFLLDRRLNDATGASASLERALAITPGIGPVRAAFVDHAVHHRDDARLAALLESESELEADAARAARLELDAALAHLRAGAPLERAVRLLERALGRAPTSRLVDGRVAEELARLHERGGDHRETLRVRKASLQYVDDVREELLVLRAIAASAERAGEIDDAVLALERARVLDPEDESVFADLDRLLTQGDRHEARAVLWMRHAALLEEPAKKAAALLASAEAAHAAGREGDAARQREAAWLTAPGAPGVYDALASTIAAAAPARHVEERIALYQQAIVATRDPDRKIHLLEKLAWLRDDVLGDVAGAVHTYEEILAIEPGRLSAIVGLASAALRRGDPAALARALAAQADVTTDLVTQAELRLQAAEALAKVDEERAQVLAEGLVSEAPSRVKRGAAELVTRLHASGERWERVAASLAARAADADDGPRRRALVLAEATVLVHRLHAPERALDALGRLGPELCDDAGVRAASLDALEVLGDDARLRASLVEMAGRAASPTTRARLLVRAAELDEAAARDAEAIAAYRDALRDAPLEPLVAERLERLGARAALGEAAEGIVGPLRAAIRALDAGDGSAEPVLALGSKSIAAVRTAERLARRSGSAPQLANALALTIEARAGGLVAQRALEGLASLVAWTLPESDDYEPWERLLGLGSMDPATLDALVRRADERVREGDAGAQGASIEALRRRAELAADDTERVLSELDLAHLLRRSGAGREAAQRCRRALEADPSSLTAACLLAELADEIADTDAAVVASCALADIVASARARAQLLRDAGDLCLARSEKDRAVELFERSLHADPESVETGARISLVQRQRGAFAELARVLRETLSRAHSKEAIVPIASELADIARTNLRDPMLAVSALERVREVAPGHVPSLFLLAELFIGQHAWDKALGALAETVLATSEPSEKLVAHMGRASIYRRVLNDSAHARVELRAALEIDPHDPRALRGLLELPADGMPLDERAALLGRLVIAEGSPSDRLRALVELADVRRSLGDAAGAEGALVEAASLSPDRAMLDRVRGAVGSDPATLARVLGRVVARAHEGERPIDPSWLVSLGRLEQELGRLDDAAERYEEALRADEAHDEARSGLVRVLGALGRHAAALAPLEAMITTPSGPPMTLELVRLLESALAATGRSAEQWVARELRAVAGDLAPGELAELDGQSRSSPWVEGLSASTLRRALMPAPLGAHPCWDLGAAAVPLAGKLARVGLTEVGSSTRERVKPRAMHPLRPLFDRALRAFELVEVELAVSEGVVVPVVACEDAPWVVVPASLANAPEAYVLASLARPLVRIALGVPWLGTLGAHEVLAILVAMARQVAPGFTGLPPERVEPLVEDLEQRARRTVDRKRRRTLEELEPMLAQAAPLDEAELAGAVLAVEARAAFVLSGSLRAALGAVAPADAALSAAQRFTGAAALSAVFERPVSRALVAFALDAETTALRRSLGGR